MISVRNAIGGLGNLLFKEAYIYAQFRDGFIPDIYVQDPKYFLKYANEIKIRFGQNIGHVDEVAIHVRRGDYVNNEFYVDLFEEGYYERAIKEFPGEKFRVFSDDIEWCKGHELFKNCLFSEGNSEVDDLNLMASHKGIIMANSSFSWWAAFLSSAKVIAPAKWHPDGVERTVLLDSWIKI